MYLKMFLNFWNLNIGYWKKCQFRNFCTFTSNRRQYIAGLHLVLISSICMGLPESKWSQTNANTPYCKAQAFHIYCYPFRPIRYQYSTISDIVLPQPFKCKYMARVSEMDFLYAEHNQIAGTLWILQLIMNGAIRLSFLWIQKYLAGPISTFAY